MTSAAKQSSADKLRYGAEILKDADPELIPPDELPAIIQNQLFASEVVRAMEDLSLIERLQFVSHILCDRNHDAAYEPMDPTLVIAEGVLSDVIECLRVAHPNLCQLRR